MNVWFHFKLLSTIFWLMQHKRLADTLRDCQDSAMPRPESLKAAPRRFVARQR
jgi:hypothetical protein